MKKRHDLNILLVDDDSIDRELFIEALRQSQLNCSVSEASGGEEALSYLQSTQTLPNLVILDLNMPLKDGRETLRDIKSDKNFKHIPVVILSTSNSHFDVLQAYQSGASLFFEKPHDFEQLTEMLKTLVGLAQNYVSFARTT